MVDLTATARKHDRELRAFRRYLFSDAADDTSYLRTATTLPHRETTGDTVSIPVKEILADTNRPELRRFGPIKSITDRFALITIVGSIADQSVFTKSDQPGMVITLSVAAHHRQLDTRLNLNIEEANAWVHTILGPTWAPQVYTAGEQSGHSPQRAPGRLTTRYYYLFVDPAGHAHTPPGEFELDLSPALTK